MPSLWLTYAWVDNEDEQVDFVAQEIRRHGIDVQVDRTHLVAGKRLWPQIDKAISDPSICDAWAIYATENSLRSEACMEELAYALDRALRTRGSDFPIIGIFPTPIDRSLIPSAIATRLYANLNDPQWAERVASAVHNKPPSGPAKNIPPFRFARWSDGNGAPVYEMRPRAGRWLPLVVMVKKDERDLLRNLSHGPSDSLPKAAIVFDQRPIEDTGNGLAGLQISNAIDASNSGFAYFSKPPTQIVFGPRGETQWTLDPSLYAE